MNEPLRIGFPWLNYHHLLYFWTVAREGSIARASEELSLASPTISAQIKALEQSLGEDLFNRSGRRLVLTETGRTVFSYAEQIFSLGREMQRVVSERHSSSHLRLNVGVAPSLPKLVVHQMLKPAFEMKQSVRLVCREAPIQDLLTELATFRLDMVLTDQVLPSGAKIKAFMHPLGETPVSCFASPELAARLGPRFPQSLHHAPALLPTESAALRRSVDHWFNEHNVRPDIVAEFDDSALLKTFASQGYGWFPAVTAISDTLTRQFGVVSVGQLEGICETYVAISPDRKLKHPAVATITRAVRAMFAGQREAVTADGSAA